MFLFLLIEIFVLPDKKIIKSRTDFFNSIHNNELLIEEQIFIDWFKKKKQEQ